jgi:hypothetical protein
MRNENMNEGFRHNAKYAAFERAAGKKGFSIAAAVLLLSATMYISGCTGAASVPKSAVTPTPTPATITVAPTSIGFGSLAVGGTASQSVTISNGGGSNLSVTQVSTTAAGVTITGIALPLTIAAGSQSTFNVVFSPKAAGALSGTVSVVSDLSTTAIPVSLSGIGTVATATLTTSTNTLAFGTVTDGQSNLLPVVLTNSGNSNVTISAVTGSGAPYTTSGVSAGLILTPGQSATLNVTFAPTAAGSDPGTVAVASNATNSPDNITLSGTGSTTTTPASVSLTWTPSVSVVAGYNVYRSQTSGGPYTKLDSSIVGADTYTDTTVQSAQTYYYVVTSVTSSGVESADSTQASATTP